MTRGRAVRRAGLTALLTLAGDQLSKVLVVAALDRGDTAAVFPGIEIVNVRNTGVAFSLFSGGSAPVVAAVAAAVALAIAWTGLARRGGELWLPVGLLVGGAAGNLVDRVRGEGVVDFIDLPLWPAFNVADVAITVGVVLLVFVLAREPAAHGDG